MSSSSPSLTDRTIAGLAWAFSGAAIQALLSLLVLGALARLLRPIDFGVIGAALIVIALTQIVSQLGIGSAIVQRRNLERSHIHVGFTLSIATTLSVGIVVAFLAPTIADFFRMPDLEAVVRV